MTRILASKYRVDERIGEGGMGIVFAGHHLELNVRVAIKELQPKLAEDAGARARFLREARLAASIEEEHCARIFDVGTEENGMPYLVMEYLAGESLESRLKRTGPLPPGDAATVLMQLLAVLAEAHAKGLVHRDLKPSNLFLAERVGAPLFVKVLDFGISKEVASAETAFDTTNAALTEPRTLLGSPEYMSPEQLRDAASVDVRTDIWACGVLLYELVSGKKPFSARTLPDLYANILSQEPSPLRRGEVELPNEFVHLIEACLNKDMKARPRSAFEVAQVLAPFASDSARSLLPRIKAWSARPTMIDPTFPIGHEAPAPSPSGQARGGRWSEVRRSAPYGLAALTLAAVFATFTGPRSTNRQDEASTSRAMPPLRLTPIAQNSTVALPPPAAPSSSNSTASAPPKPQRSRASGATSGPTSEPTKETSPRIQSPDGIELIP